MWFAFDRDVTAGFWMEGTLIDLDIAWVDADGDVVSTETMSTCLEIDCDRHRPAGPYRSALEVRAGWLADNQVAVGSTIAFSTS